MYYNLFDYYTAQGLNPFKRIPLTFHIKEGPNDEIFCEIENYINGLQERKKYNLVWILKPGENSNRGNGIKLCRTI